jgi:hypothetical protein
MRPTVREWLAPTGGLAFLLRLVLVWVAPFAILGVVGVLVLVVKFGGAVSLEMLARLLSVLLVVLAILLPPCLPTSLFLLGWSSLLARAADEPRRLPWLVLYGALGVFVGASAQMGIGLPAALLSIQVLMGLVGNLFVLAPGLVIMSAFLAIAYGAFGGWLARERAVRLREATALLARGSDVPYRGSASAGRRRCDPRRR